ncbi:MAG: GNAT family N-acetyltransferase [Myxococcaceae bacterium]|nr:GNAT family N-acetyltransferase [Myxococcaceae bacterium]
MLREGLQESQRFGLRIFRGSVEELDERLLLSELLRHEVDVAIVRLLRDGHGQLHRLQALGLPYIVADTLVYYSCDLTQHEPGGQKNEDVAFIECGPAHAEVVDRLVETSFADYKNHYSMNPLLDPRGLVAGYQEWARGFITGADPHRRAWVVRAGEEPIAFATCSFEGDTSEVVLNGVHPAHAGRGIYGDLLRFIQRVSKQQGLTRMRISTQVSNFAVQKVWARNGFSLTDAYLTVHINALLSARGAHGLVREVVLSAEELPRFSQSSGALAASLMARVFTEEFPGPGTAIVQQSFRVLRPLSADRPYRFQYAFHPRDPAKGPWLAVVTVRDDAGNVYLLSQSLLSRR